MRRLLIMLSIPLFISCAVLHQPARLHEGDIKLKYQDQIEDWQKRVQSDGWTSGMVDDIVSTIQVFSKYQSEKKDIWFTPGEMVQADFTGDCEDIGALIFGTLKKLRYPGQVRLMIVGTLIPSDHMLVRVQLPGGKWKKYETVKIFMSEIDGLFYRPKLEFDDKQIWSY